MSFAIWEWLLGFYLFNIQVRANCTTACNIQAALQYVELTRIKVSVFFFSVSVLQKEKKKKVQEKKKKCMQLGMHSQVMPAPPHVVAGGVCRQTGI